MLFLIKIIIIMLIIKNIIIITKINFDLKNIFYLFLKYFLKY